MDDTISILKDFKEKNKLDDWKVTRIFIQRANEYVTKDNEKESFLTSEREELHVTVYKKLENGKLGETNFVVKDSKDIKLITEQIEEAIMLSQYSEKEIFNIPDKNENKKISQVVMSDSHIVNGFKNGNIELEINKIFKDLQNEMQKYPEVKLNGSEILMTNSRRDLVNSKGVELSQSKTSVYIEVVLTAKNSEREMEFFPCKIVSCIKDMKISEFLSENIQNVNDVLNSKGSIHYEGAISLSGDALKEYFVNDLGISPIVAHCSARFKYMKFSRYEIGKDIVEGIKGDRVTILSNPTIDYNPMSSKFDEDGVISQKLELIKDGKVMNYFAAKRFADYLNINATGQLGSVEILPGSVSSEELLKEGVEIVSFASFTPNVISGDFSAEIRLGYLIKDGEKVPFRGGMFTGNAFELAKNMKLSKEVVKRTGYLGPRVVMFCEGVVAGL